MNARLLKIRSVHTYLLKGFYSCGVNCIFFKVIEYIDIIQQIADALEKVWN